MATQQVTHKYGTGKDAILRATIKVVADCGLRGLTFRAVGREAGVANSLVAHYFGTREKLITAALEWATAESLNIARLDPAFLADPGFAEKLVDLVESDADLQFFQYEMVLESRRRPELRDVVRGHLEAFVASYGAALTAAGVYREDLSLARTVFAATDGIVLHHLVLQNRPRSVKSLNHIRDMALRDQPAAAAADEE